MPIPEVSSTRNASLAVNRRPTRVCIYRRGAHAVFDSTIHRTFGGAEIHAVLMAKLLASRPGFRTRFVVDHVGQSHRQWIEGLEVVTERDMTDDCCDAYRRLVDRSYTRFRSYGRISEHFPWLHLQRFPAEMVWQVPLLVWHKCLNCLPRTTRRPAWRPALVRDADVTCCFGVTPDAADVVFSCKRTGTTSIVFVMGDSQLHCRERCRFLDIADYSAEDARLMEYALGKADYVVVQSQQQQQLLQDSFGRTGTIIRNPVQTCSAPGPEAERKFVFWVGRADLIHKRSDLLLELCRQCPAIPFCAVINRFEPGVFEETCRGAPENLRIIDRATPREVAELLRHTVLLLNTSASEGFPNAFLQAAAENVPVLSLKVDPDGFCSQHGCGIACGGDLTHCAGNSATLARSHVTDGNRSARACLRATPPRCRGTMRHTCGDSSFKEAKGLWFPIVCGRAYRSLRPVIARGICWDAPSIACWHSLIPTLN